jgi:hypothetical protein
MIDNWEFISNDIPQDSPSEKLNTYVQMASPNVVLMGGDR